MSTQDNTEEVELTNITITYEDGTEDDCLILDVFTVEELGDQEYAALLVLPEGYEDSDEDELEGDLFVCRYAENGDDISIETIEDEEEEATVQAAYEKILEEADEEA